VRNRTACGMLQTRSMIPVGVVPEKLPGVVFVTLCFIWASTWLAIKVGLDFPPFLFARARVAVASLFLMFLVPLLQEDVSEAGLREQMKDYSCNFLNVVDSI
jgi:hypothetical protein